MIKIRFGQTFEAMQYKGFFLLDVSRSSLSTLNKEFLSTFNFVPLP